MVLNLITIGDDAFKQVGEDHSRKLSVNFIYN